MRSVACILFLFLLAIAQKSAAQSCPPNIDFEDGDFSNWECFTGKTAEVNGKNAINLTLSGPVSSRHEIISAASPNKLDPYGRFPTLCPYGGNYSVKLGNNQTGAEAEGMSYTFIVPSAIDTFTFTYFYAVVFQEPGHPLPDQPRFYVTAYEVATGRLINCASFDYVSNGAIPGFEKSTTSSGVLFKNWTPASLQFAGLGGKQVRLEFRTADCTQGGHFGYAYLDVGSGCSNILATAPYCRETNSLILNAPYGFKTYTWYTEDYSAVVGNQQSLTLSPPPADTGSFYVDVEPYPGYGCRDTLQAIVRPLPVPDTPSAQSVYRFCQSQGVPSLTATPDRGLDILWYTAATGGTGSAAAPVLSSAKAGQVDYYVTQKVLFGCESLRKKVTAEVIPLPLSSFTINAITQCQSDNAYIFTNTSTNRSQSIFNWDLGNSTTISSATDTIVKYTYNTAGNFTVKLKVVNSGLCSTEKSGIITVVPKPVASFTYPPVLCVSQTPVNILNTSLVARPFTINKWWWSLNDSIQQTATPAVFTAAKPGPLPVKLVVTTSEGCHSDTSTAVLNIHYRPSASFTYSAPLCNNEILRFTDLSFMPQAAAGESVQKWYWQFDAATTSSLQHPIAGFATGMHHTKLIAESNFGCQSTEADSLFEIHPKPQITVNISDSCVFRTINYQAADLINTGDKWYWNFGSGFKKGSDLVSKSFSTEGSQTFTLMAETIYGCRDTITRQFIIYDNKALAGRDTIAAWDEPVQLNAKGGTNVTYSWTPKLGLDNPALENPVAILDRDQLYYLDALTDKGCDSHSKILIRRYKGPELYIPNAFTPNGNGKNEVLRVFPVGIKAFSFFAVYDRYGERIYHTTDPKAGWDGRYKGIELPSGTFIAYATAIDYKGHVLSKKITVQLIR